MNTFNGTIVDIQSSVSMSMVQVDVNGAVFSAIVLETPVTAPYLERGRSIGLMFKETEVAIAKGLTGMISMRNRFPGRIEQMQRHSLLTTVHLAWAQGTVVAIISTDSARRLALIPGDEVEWLVKTNEVSLCPTT